MIRVIEDEVPAHFLAGGIKGWCMRCKSHNEMERPEMGLCGESPRTSRCIAGWCQCGTRTLKFIGNIKQTDYPPGYWNDIKRRRRAKKLADKMLVDLPKLEVAYE